MWLKQLIINTKINLQMIRNILSAAKRKGQHLLAVHDQKSSPGTGAAIVRISAGDHGVLD